MKRDWLKESIQPSVPQKDMVLNAGLIQYLDYLENELGISGEKSILLDKCRDWFDRNIQIGGDIPTKNGLLYDFYTWLDKTYVTVSPQADMEGVSTLKNIINEKNDELMSTFLHVTKDFFTVEKYPLLKKYHLNHHFTYYYISIRDKAWPKGIDFGWYPLGMNKLSNSDSLTFYFKLPMVIVDFSSAIEKTLKDLGYRYHEKSRSYRVEVSVPQFEGRKYFLNLNSFVQKVFIESVYQRFACPIIRLLHLELKQIG